LGANHVSLIEGQANFANLGVCEPRFLANVRPAQADDARDPGWRRLDPAIDNVERRMSGLDHGTTYPSDLTDLYYWRPNYWRRK
jgi:hypothetical protein